MKRRHRSIALLMLIAVNVLTVRAALQADERAAIDVGSKRQLFLDRGQIASMQGTRLVLHQPVRREIAIANEHPWERYGISYMVTFRDGERFRAWYRCDPAPLEKGDKRRSITAYAESTDGIHWVKPELGLIEFQGSKQNNLVWTGPGRNMAVFRDDNPAAPDEERYKAIVRHGNMFGLVSPDGLRWRMMRDEPILTEGPFDSHNIAFWDGQKNEYAAYTRGARTGGSVGVGMKANFRGGVRSIRRATSKDFRNWSPLELIELSDSPLEHLYTNATVAYDRAPGVYLMFPSRFANARRPDPDWPRSGVNDIVMLSSRDGFRFERTFLEAFVRPGLDQKNWHDRSLYMERGILETSPTELSMYAMENWRLDTVHIRRLTLRPDGFVSVQAPYEGGELTTRPLTFQGNELRLNVSTSAVGSVRVEIQNADGQPLPDFSLDDCPVLYGDFIDQAVRWENGSDVSRLSGQPVRLRFVLRDADLYAYRFAE